MANSDRIQHLLNFLAEDPNDAFTRYALALEYQKSDPEKAEELFEHLLTMSPEYLPSYYMAAMLKLELSKPEEAIGLLKNGIDVAAQVNDQVTLRELKEALKQLVD